MVATPASLGYSVRMSKLSDAWGGLAVAELEPAPFDFVTLTMRDIYMKMGTPACTARAADGKGWLRPPTRHDLERAIGSECKGNGLKGAVFCEKSLGHKRNFNWHAHAVFQPGGRVDSRQGLYDKWRKAHGFVAVRQVEHEDTEAVAEYAAKVAGYVAKDHGAGAVYLLSPKYGKSGMLKL